MPLLGRMTNAVKKRSRRRRRRSRMTMVMTTMQNSDACACHIINQNQEENKTWLYQVTPGQLLCVDDGARHLITTQDNTRVCASRVNTTTTTIHCREDVKQRLQALYGEEGQTNQYLPMRGHSTAISRRQRWPMKLLRCWRRYEPACVYVCVSMCVCAHNSHHFVPCSRT